MFIRSIRFRLTSWYALTLAVVLTASSLFWYVALSRNMLKHIDERLYDVAKTVENAHRTKHRVLTINAACSDLDTYIIEHNWAGYAQVRNNLGNLICTINTVNGAELPLDKSALLQITKHLPHFETLYDFGETPIRTLTYPIFKEGRLERILQLGETLASTEHTLSDLKTLFLMFSPFTIVILTFCGWFLANRALNPVIEITSAAMKITAENLNARLPIHEPNDELAKLSETFNSMLARLEESFSRIKQFSADASHELRTPLAILKGETEVTLRWAKSEEELRQTLESNLEEINLMSRILEDLLALAKSEARDLHLEIEEFSLSDLMQDLYLTAKTLAEPLQHVVQLNMKVDAEILMWGDQIQLYRMLLNIINNSVKYTRPGGSINMSFHVEDDQAVIAIRDSGVGIPEEHLPHIFDRFYRIDAARNREDGGTGLGLSIVKAIVDAHGGHINVSSEVGEGTTFTVTLPLCAKKPEQRIED